MPPRRSGRKAPESKPSTAEPAANLSDAPPDSPRTASDDSAVDVKPLLKRKNRATSDDDYQPEDAESDAHRRAEGRVTRRKAEAADGGQGGGKGEGKGKASAIKPRVDDAASSGAYNPAAALASDKDALDASSRGGPAANELYRTTEIFERILALLDSASLASLTRVEKGVTAIAARFLYHTIPASLISRMSRASARRVVYCDAVRVIDRTYRYKPPPPKNPRRSYHREMPDRSPLLDHKELLKSLSTCLKKCPNLQRIECELPTGECDPIYVLHIRPRIGEADPADARDYTLELDLVEKLTLGRSDLVEGKVEWPQAREFAGIDVVRNRFIVGFKAWSVHEGERFEPAGPLRVQQTRAWRDWFVSDNCDWRLAGFDRLLQLDMRADECIDIALERAHRDPPTPLAYISGDLELAPGGSWMDFLNAALPAFGPALRRLDVGLYVRRAIDDDTRVVAVPPESLPECIALINAHTPHLQSLRLRLETRGLTHALITNHFCRSPSLRGPLRLFNVDWLTANLYDRNLDVSQVLLARAMAPFGSSRCHHSYGQVGSVQAQEEFNRFVRLCQSSGPEGQALRAGQLQRAGVLAYDDPDATVLVDTKEVSELLAYLEEASTTLRKEQADMVDKMTRYMADTEEWQKQIDYFTRMMHNPPTGAGAVQKIADAWRRIPEAGYTVSRQWSGIERPTFCMRYTNQNLDKKGEWLAKLGTKKED